MLHVDVDAVIKHDFAAAEQRSDRRPLPARVHQRAERERDELWWAGVALGKERPQSLRGIVDHGRGDLFGMLQRGAAGIPTTHGAEEDVLVAPQHALRHAGGSSGVQHIAIVGGTGSEITGGRRSFEGRRERLVFDVEHEANVGATRRDAGGALTCTRVVHDPHRVGVGEQVLELVVDVSVVDVDRHGAQLVTREHRLEMLDRVLHVKRDVRAGGGASRREHMGEPRRSLVELRVATPLGAADRGLAFGDGIGDALEEICEVELHPDTVPDSVCRHYSPILA